MGNNKNSTQNQNVFQRTARDLLGISSLNIKSSNESIMKAVDEGNFLCGIFVDLEKTIDTVDHNILLKRLDHCGVRGISNKWFESYLTDRKQFDSINSFNSLILT